MMAFELPKLSYAYNALEPHIDARTMEIHHTKHHQAYVTNLNNAVNGTEMEKQSLEQLMAGISKHPAAVRNNGGGHYNHSLFWEIMMPGADPRPGGEVAAAIEKELGGFDKFKADFIQAGATRFGSGWAWLCVTSNGTLAVCSTPNQDNPLMDIADCKGQPILGMDVWEHAYYLNYQNRRPDYMNAFFNVINWKKVNELYLKYKKQ
ncbi:MAG: superoxide dismutase [Bacteroidia bacterium]|nr:superoxide dismutase [Bacteroidia bacterium]